MLPLPGYTRASRRCELAWVIVQYLTFGSNGSDLLMRCSKTEQVGADQLLAIPYARTITAMSIRIELGPINGKGTAIRIMPRLASFEYRLPWGTK